MCNRKTIAVFLAVLMSLMLQTSTVKAHWDMESRFWSDGSKERFFFRIHNGEHANRRPVKREMDVCFWMEKLSDGLYRQISEKKCSAATVKPDEWLTFTFDLKEVAFYDDAKRAGKLKEGSYRAVAKARELKGKLAKLLFGAALERLYIYFDIK